MTVRGQRLMDGDPDTVQRVMSHRAQLETVVVIEALLRRLRQLKEWVDYYEFQRELFEVVYNAQLEQAAASKNAKRHRAGKRTPTPPSGDWQTERWVWDRIVRQYRTVGDALAWRLLRFDRRAVIVLSRNAPVSPMVGKAGLDFELGAVVERWEENGHFALMHDLTNVLRIADLTIFTPDGLWLQEVKSAPDGGRSQQQQRVERALAILRGDAPLADDVELQLSSQQFKTHLRELEDGLHLALEQDSASLVVHRHLVVSCMSLVSKTPDQDINVVRQLRDQRQERAFKKAGLDKVTHQLSSHRIDEIGRDEWLAPFTVYPVAPDICARLTTDYLAFTATLAWDRLALPFERNGFDVECPLTEANITERAARILLAHKNGRVMTIHAAALAQLVLELVDVDRYAAALFEIADEAPRRSSPVSGVLTFANERAVWR